MVDETTRILSDIQQRMVRVETKIDSMNDVKTTAEEAKETAVEALQQSKSAHHRITEKSDDIKELKDNQTWLWRTVLGAVIVGALAFLWRGGN